MNNEYVNFYTVIERKEKIEKVNGDMVVVIVTRID